MPDPIVRCFLHLAGRKLRGVPADFAAGASRIRLAILAAAALVPAAGGAAMVQEGRVLLGVVTTAFFLAMAVFHGAAMLVKEPASGE